MEFMEELLARLLRDPVYLERLEMLKRLDPEYIALRSSLDEENGRILDSYISLCEEIDDIVCGAAYALGKEHRLQTQKEGTD